MSASIRHLPNEKHSKIEYSSDYEIKLLLDINLIETEEREFAYIRYFTLAPSHSSKSLSSRVL